MSRTVVCRKFKKEMPGLAKPPFPGPKGQEIFDTVSQEAWSSWQQHQTMLINEKHLNMADPQARAYLQEQMEKFLDDADFEQIEGYVPPEK